MNNSLVVFIHGVFGKGVKTWDGIPEFIQEECLNSSAVRSFDFYIFNYQTTSILQPPLDPYVIAELREFLNGVSDKYDCVVLFCHSQGGLVAKLYVIDELEANKGKNLKVDSIYCLGTPHRGSLLLVPMYYIYRILTPIPFCGRILPFRQFVELASVSPNIKRIKKYWNENIVSTTPIPSSESKRYIDSICFVGAFDEYVREKSAEGFHIDRVVHLTSNHTKMSKVTKNRYLAHHLVRELEKIKSPFEIVKQIKIISRDKNNGNGDAFTKYIEDHYNSIDEIVISNRSDLNEEGRTLKVASLLSDFLTDFPHRPLRNLDLKDSLVKYVNLHFSKEM